MSTKITYNGKTTELADGYIATLPCKDYKMATDVVVEAPESSGESGGSGAIDLTNIPEVESLEVTEDSPTIVKYNNQIYLLVEGE